MKNQWHYVRRQFAKECGVILILHYYVGVVDILVRMGQTQAERSDLAAAFKPTAASFL